MRRAAAEGRARPRDIGTDAKKYRPGLDPLEKEATITDIQPIGLEESERMMKMINRLLERGGLKNAEKNAFQFWKAQLAVDNMKGLVKREFLRDFWAWLLGRGKESDHKKCPWYRQSLANDEEVAIYCDTFLVKRTEFQIKLQLLRMRHPIGINQHYLYFKYVVRGEEPDADHFLEDWQLFVEEFETARIEGNAERNKNKFGIISDSAGNAIYDGEGAVHEMAPYGPKRAEYAKKAHSKYSAKMESRAAIAWRSDDLSDDEAEKEYEHPRKVAIIDAETEKRVQDRDRGVRPEDPLNAPHRAKDHEPVDDKGKDDFFPDEQPKDVPPEEPKDQRTTRQKVQDFLSTLNSNYMRFADPYGFADRPTLLNPEDLPTNGATTSDAQDYIYNQGWDTDETSVASEAAAEKVFAEAARVEKDAQKADTFYADLEKRLNALRDIDKVDTLANMGKQATRDEIAELEKARDEVNKAREALERQQTAIREQQNELLRQQGDRISALEQRQPVNVTINNAPVFSPSNTANPNVTVSPTNNANPSNAFAPTANPSNAFAPTANPSTAVVQPAAPVAPTVPPTEAPPLSAREFQGRAKSEQENISGRMDAMERQLQALQGENTADQRRLYNDLAAENSRLQRALQEAIQRQAPTTPAMTPTEERRAFEQMFDARFERMRADLLLAFGNANQNPVQAVNNFERQHADERRRDQENMAAQLRTTEALLQILREQTLQNRPTDVNALMQNVAQMFGGRVPAETVVHLQDHIRDLRTANEQARPNAAAAASVNQQTAQMPVLDTDGLRDRIATLEGIQRRNNDLIDSLIQGNANRAATQGLMDQFKLMIEGLQKAPKTPETDARIDQLQSRLRDQEKKTEQQDRELKKAMDDLEKSRNKLISESEKLDKERKSVAESAAGHYDKLKKEVDSQLEALVTEMKRLQKITSRPPPSLEPERQDSVSTTDTADETEPTVVPVSADLPPSPETVRPVDSENTEEPPPLEPAPELSPPPVPPVVAPEKTPPPPPPAEPVKDELPPPKRPERPRAETEEQERPPQGGKKVKQDGSTVEQRPQPQKQKKTGAAPRPPARSAAEVLKDEEDKEDAEFAKLEEAKKKARERDGDTATDDRRKKVSKEAVAEAPVAVAEFPRKAETETDNRKGEKRERAGADALARAEQMQARVEQQVEGFASLAWDAQRMQEILDIAAEVLTDDERNRFNLSQLNSADREAFDRLGALSKFLKIRIEELQMRRKRK